MYALNSAIDFPVTRYYFDTFILGQYSSTSHLVRDLINMREVAAKSINAELPSYKVKELKKLIDMIESELSNYNINAELANLEENEPVHWMHKLGRQAGLEISTYGRIRPETMNLLMCIPEENFEIAMSIAGRLSIKIQALGEESLMQNTPVPSTVPVI